MTTTFPQLTSIEAGDYRIRVMLADRDPEEHLLVSLFAAHWAPQLEFVFARDGGDLLMQLAFIQEVKDLPNVIVLNYDMPRLDGFQALCELQAHPVLWQIPVVVVSDRSERDVEVNCYRAGARCFLPRPRTPVEMGELLVRIEEIASGAPLDISSFTADLEFDAEMLFD